MDLTSAEIFGVALFVVALLGVAGFFSWRQVVALQGLRREGNLPPDDRRYYHRQAWRRLLGCGLMMVVAVLLASWYLLGGARELRELHEQVQAAGVPPASLEPEKKRFLNFSLTFWIVILLLVLGWLCLAILDYLAIRRFGLRHFRQLQADRRAMIEREVGLLRSQRNGHEGPESD